MNNIKMTTKHLYVFIFTILVFLLGYIFTIEHFKEYIFEYTLYNIISLICFLFYLMILRGDLKLTFPGWLFFWIFILAYYLKFYWVIVDDSLLTNRAHFYIGLIDNQPLLLNVFQVMTFGFLSISLASYFIKKAYFPSTKKLRIAKPNTMIVSKLSVFITFSVIIFIFIFTLFFSANLKMGKGIILANNMTGAIVYLRTLVLPILIIFFIWQGYQNKNKRIILLGVTILLLYGLADGILRDSKSSLLFSVILLMFFLLLHGIKLKKKMKLILFMFFSVSILSYPVMKEYREGFNTDHASLFEVAKDFYSSKNISRIITEPASMVLSRIIGVGSLSVVISKNQGPLYLDGIKKIIQVDMHNYVNDEIFGSRGSAPSYIGFFYLLAGFLGILILMPFFTLLIYKAWVHITTIKIPYSSVLQAGFLKLLLGELSDGDLGRGIVFRIPVFICTMLLCAFLLRIGRTNKRVSASKYYL